MGLEVLLDLESRINIRVIDLIKVTYFISYKHIE